MLTTSKRFICRQEQAVCAIQHIDNDGIPVECSSDGGGFLFLLVVLLPDESRTHNPHILINANMRRFRAVGVHRALCKELLKLNSTRDRRIDEMSLKPLPVWWTHSWLRLDIYSINVTQRCSNE